MGNCQAIDTATLVIQYPSGKSENLYWPMNASEVMKANPGHYVALLISTTLCPNQPQQQEQSNNTTANNNLLKTNNNNTNNNNGSVRLTRIKLLRPTDSLVLGQVYRLIPTQEVMKGLWAKKQARLNRGQTEGGVRVEIVGNDKPRIKGSDHQLEKDNKVIKQERHRSRTSSSSSSSSSSSTTSSAVTKPRNWQPSLLSISEATS